MNKPTWIGYTLDQRYHIEALIGQGGMSAVYRATDPNLRRTVAIKLIHPHLSVDPEFIRRFEEEATTVAQLRHPNIVQVYDFDHDGDIYYMVLEFLPGETLQTQLKSLSGTGQRLTFSRTIQIISSVCGAVQYAHQHGTIHRDLKPSNVMIDPQGQPILMDFGLAKILGGQQQTVSGTLIGTPAYMSPEQVRSDRLDGRTDIYSLGVMLFEMVTGRPPFDADSAMTLMLKHLNEPVPDIREINRDVPEPLIAVIEKALQKDPANRFQTATDMELALGAAAQPIGLTIRPTVPRSREALEQQPSLTPTVVGAPPAQPHEPDNTPTLPAPMTSAPPTIQVARQPLSVSGQLKSAKRLPMPLLLLISLSIVGLIVIVLAIAASAPTSGVANPTPGANPTSTRNSTIAEATATSAAIVPVVPTETRAPTQEPTATPKPVPPGMVLVASGTFTLGSSASSVDEAPPHSVTLDAFYVDQYEVTNARYETCVQAGTCTRPRSLNSFTRSSYYNNPTYLDHPVVNVTWNQAYAFCNWAGNRLPTEAEWEYAATGGNGRRYPWGNDFDPNKLPAQQPDTTAVGSFPDGVSPFNVFNMAGNVVEWIADWYSADYYARSEDHNPTGPANGTERVMRGGAFGTLDAGVYTTARRYKRSPNRPDVDIGFRCVQSATP